MRTKRKTDLAADATPDSRPGCPASSHGVGHADGELLSAPGRRRRGAELALALAALLGACAGDPARDADRAYTAGLARVERIEVELVSTRPPRLRVAVAGFLADACTELDPPRIRPLGARIEISLETRRPFGARCAPGEAAFDRSVPVMLGGGFRFYVVDVNGVSASVALPPERDVLPFAPDPAD